MYGAENLIDQSPAEMAGGTVTVDEQGRPMTYTAAPGDHIARISGYRGYEVIQPGDALTLNADHVTDWVGPYALP